MVDRRSLFPIRRERLSPFSYFLTRRGTTQSSCLFSGSASNEPGLSLPEVHLFATWSRLLLQLYPLGWVRFLFPAGYAIASPSPP